MSGNVSGNDTGNVSRTCIHIISNEIKLVNRNLVEDGLEWYFINFSKKYTQKTIARDV